MITANDITTVPKTGKHPSPETKQGSTLPLFQREPYLLKPVFNSEAIARHDAPTLDELKMSPENAPAI